MKIAFIYRARNIHILQRAKALHNLGHQIVYFGFFPKESDIDISNFSFIEFVDFAPVLNKISFLDYVINRKNIMKKCIKLNVDLIHIQSPIYFASYFSNKVPYIIENMGSDVILLSKYSLIRRLIYYFAFKGSSAVIQDSFIAKRAGIRLGARVFSNYVIDIGVDFNIFNKNYGIVQAKEKLRIDSNCRIIFSPRAMGENYNIDLILDIVPSILDKYSDVIFIFAMTPTSNRLKLTFKEIINKYGDRVQVAGYLDNTKELPLYYSASSLVLSIPTSDSSPLSVFESMACGTLVLVSKHAWYRGKFFENKHLYSTNLNSDDLLDKIEFILNSHGTYIQDNAYDRVSSRYRHDVQVKKLDFLYNKELHNGF